MLSRTVPDSPVADVEVVATSISKTYHSEEEFSSSPQLTITTRFSSLELQSDVHSTIISSECEVECSRITTMSSDEEEESYSPQSTTTTMFSSLELELLNSIISSESLLEEYSVEQLELKVDEWLG